MALKLVPEEELEKIEKARKELYEMFPDLSTEELMRLQKITEPLWAVANRKWDVIDEAFNRDMEVSARVMRLISKKFETFDDTQIIFITKNELIEVVENA